MSLNRLLPIEAGHNFRELGGYQTTDGRQVQWHRLIRAGALGQLSEADLALLAQLNVTADIDFRSPTELEAAADRVPHTATYHHEPVFDTDRTESSKTNAELEPLLVADPDSGARHMEVTYQEMVTEPTSKTAYQHFFAHLLATPSDGAVLFHCTAGKDQTGVGAFLLLSALGVDTKTIEQDYLLTNQVNEAFVNELLQRFASAGKNETYVHNFRSLATVSPRYLNATKQAIATHYGTVNDFLTTGLGLSAGNLADLKQLYLV